MNELAEEMQRVFQKTMPFGLKVRARHDQFIVSIGPSSHAFVLATAATKFLFAIQQAGRFA